MLWQQGRLSWVFCRVGFPKKWEGWVRSDRSSVAWASAPRLKSEHLLKCFHAWTSLFTSCIDTLGGVAPPFALKNMD